MTDDRPPIPAEIKREVRQRCGFGCVICGQPLVHYDHIIDYKDVKEHKGSNLTLLCPTDHQKKTNGLMSLAKLQEAIEAPRNLQVGVTAPFLLDYEDESPVLVMGQYEFKAPSSADCFIPLMMDGVVMLAFTKDDDKALISMQMFDEFNFPQLIVKQNEIVVATGMYDVQLKGKRLIVCEGPGKILADFLFDIDKNRIQFERGTFRFNGMVWRIRKDKPLVLPSGPDGSVHFGGHITFGTEIGVGLGICPYDSIGIRLPQINRYKPFVPPKSPNLLAT